jgi:hypothetical protein
MADIGRPLNSETFRLPGVVLRHTLHNFPGKSLVSSILPDFEHFFGDMPNLFRASLPCAMSSDSNFRTHLIRAAKFRLTNRA